MQAVVVKVWNETVANLTLMALGSSAPEIMLSVIEIWAKGFHAGDLGPGKYISDKLMSTFFTDILAKNLKQNILTLCCKLCNKRFN